MLIMLTAPLIHSGDQASPEARSAALNMKFTAKATLKMHSQRMFSAAKASVCGSSPKTPATLGAKNTPKTVTTSENADASTSDAMVTRLASV